MRRFWKSIVALMWIAVALTVGPLRHASAEDRAAKPCPQAPGAAPELKAGDVLAVAVDRTNLMLGDQVVAAVPRGQQLLVMETRDHWIGGQTMIDGRQLSGWVRMEDFIPRNLAPGLAGASPATPGGPRPYTVGYEPAAASPPPQPAVVTMPIVAPAASRSYSDAWLIGRFERHEPDPNMHVWEPWRQ